MAITVGASTQGNGNTASVDLPIPTHAAGDLLLAWFESTGQAIGATPAGWTLAGSTSTRGSIYTRFDTAGTLTGTASWGLTASNRWAGGITAFSGVDPAIWDLGAPTISGATTASLVLPGISPPDTGTVLVTGFANSSPTIAATVPAGFTAQNTVSSSGYVVLATQPWPNAGTATGDVTWNQSASRACGGFLGALKPAGGAAPPAAGTPAAQTITLSVTTPTGTAPSVPVAAGTPAGQTITATATNPAGTAPTVPVAAGTPSGQTITLTIAAPTGTAPTVGVNAGTPANQTITATASSPTGAADNTGTPAPQTITLQVSNPAGTAPAIGAAAGTPRDQTITLTVTSPVGTSSDRQPRDLQLLSTTVPVLTWTASGPVSGWTAAPPATADLPTTTPASAWATSTPEH